jgi:hypothetical protein
MTDREPPDTGSAARLIEEAQAARVAAHIRAILLQLKSRIPKPSPKPE